MAVLLGLLLFSSPAAAKPTWQADSEAVPLNELGLDTYLGQPGGLYPEGQNRPPSAHALAGFRRTLQIRPLDLEGRPSAQGKIVLLSIGMSNASQEFCHNNPRESCWPWSFIGLAGEDLDVAHDHLVIVNGARAGQTVRAWMSPESPNYTALEDSLLPTYEVSPLQVQVIWLKQVHSNPQVSIPDQNSDARLLARDLAALVRTLKIRFPNLQQVFLSSRTYGGYSTDPLNPEPYAYESGFAVKWLIGAQIAQQLRHSTPPGFGELRYTAHIPWLAWGPYLWANGDQTRADGFEWLADDVTDGIHPSEHGIQKVAEALLIFFKSSPFTACWFLADGDCGQLSLPAGLNSPYACRPGGAKIERPRYSFCSDRP